MNTKRIYEERRYHIRDPGVQAFETPNLAVYPIAAKHFHMPYSPLKGDIVSSFHFGLTVYRVINRVCTSHYLLRVAVEYVCCN